MKALKDACALIVQWVDKQFLDLYQIESPYRATEFLIPPGYPLPSLKKDGWSILHGKRVSTESITNHEIEGAFLVSYQPTENRSPEIVELGIYLSEPIRKILTTLLSSHAISSDPQVETFDQFSAFNVLVEEVSHFRYFSYHTLACERTVSQFEMELQAEIDKFLLSLKLLSSGHGDFTTLDESTGKDLGIRRLFETLLDQHFYSFHLANNLSDEQVLRYLDASAYAKTFLYENREACIEWISRDSSHRFDHFRSFFKWGVDRKMAAIYQGR